MIIVIARYVWQTRHNRLGWWAPEGARAGCVDLRSRSEAGTRGEVEGQIGGRCLALYEDGVPLPAGAVLLGRVDELDGPVSAEARREINRVTVRSVRTQRSLRDALMDIFDDRDPRDGERLPIAPTRDGARQLWVGGQKIAERKG